MIPAWCQFWQEAVVEPARGATTLGVELMFLFQILCTAIAIGVWLSQRG